MLQCHTRALMWHRTTYRSGDALMRKTLKKFQVTYGLMLTYSCSLQVELFYCV